MSKKRRKEIIRLKYKYRNISTNIVRFRTRYRAHDIRVSVHVVAVKRFYDGPRCFYAGFTDNPAISIQRQHNRYHFRPIVAPGENYCRYGGIVLSLITRYLINFMENLTCYFDDRRLSKFTSSIKTTPFDRPSPCLLLSPSIVLSFADLLKFIIEITIDVGEQRFHVESRSIFRDNRGISSSSREISNWTRGDSEDFEEINNYKFNGISRLEIEVYFLLNIFLIYFTWRPSFIDIDTVKF